MRMRIRSAGYVSLAAGLTLSGALALSVQSQAAEESAISGDAAREQTAGGLEEIIVTAQRRSENLQRVPILVAAVTSTMLQKDGAFKTDELQNSIPGLYVSHELNSVTAFIRGIGPNSNGWGQESSVAVYLDDLYIPQGAASVFSLNGIDSVQVLKGPQGTLFGRNATGGVIQVLTKTPDFAPSLDFHAGYASYNTPSTDLYATGPLIPDTLAGNISIYGYNQQNGWGRDVVTGEKTFTAKEFGVRAKLLYTPTDSTRAILSFAHLYARGESGIGLQQVPSFVATGGHGLAGATFVGWYNNQDYRNDSSVNSHNLMELRIDQETKPAKIVSITGYQYTGGEVHFAQDGSPAGIIRITFPETAHNVSQEFQFLNPTDASYASWLKWTAGAYYLHDTSGYHQFTVQNLFGLTDSLKTTSYAGYGQAMFEILPDTNLTLGARYTSDHRQIAGGSYNLGVVPVLPVGTPLATIGESDPLASKTWDMVTYRVALDHRFTNDIMGYVSFNRGVRSGQFDVVGSAVSGLLGDPPVQPEVIYSTELGAKTQFWDQRVRLNVAAFHYDIKQLQFTIITAGSSVLKNAAGAKVDGADIDLTVRASERLTLSSAMSILHGRYSNFPDAPALFNPPTFTIDARGNQTVRTPNFTGHLAADYVVPFGKGELDLNANYTYTDTFQWFADGSLPQPVVHLFGASILWTSPTSRYDVRLWGNNLSGAHYYAFGSESTGLGKEFSPAAPRTYGLTFGLHL